MAAGARAKRAASGPLALALVALAVAGCGEKSEPDFSTVETTPTVTTPTTTTPAPTTPTPAP